MNKKYLIYTLVLVILIIAGTAYFMKGGSKEITVDTIDLATAEGRDRVPDGIPENLPLDWDRVTESQVATYNNSDVKLSTFTYSTSTTQSALTSLYYAYMADNGYSLKDGSIQGKVQFIMMTKDNDDISVSITDMGGSRVVQLVYTDRK